MSSHSTHTKMLVAPARLNLRRGGSYNHLERGPLSSTSSRFNFNHLLFSPPPSPSLPALVPRPKRSPSQILVARPSRVFRRLFLLAGLLTIVYFVVLLFGNRDVMPAVWPYFAPQEDLEMVGQDAFPDFPTPVVISDVKGRSKWTISIPHDYDFPLSIDQYADMSGQCREVSSRARDLHHKTPISEQTMLSYDAPDDYFVDVYEAERTGLLPPPPKGLRAVKEVGHIVGMDQESIKYKPVCQSSMIFVLETPDAGLGNTLMMMWTFYGLAKEQGRAFFIDDSRWAYGPYTDIFASPPIPDCRAPPRYHMVPCPFQARHLVVSSVTAKEVFPALLAKSHRMGGADSGLRGLFELAHTGYQAMFGLNKQDQSYVDGRINGIRTKAKVDDANVPDVPVIGLHIRHGDQHPIEYQYRDGYIPSEVFLESVGNLVEEYYNKTSTDAVTNRDFMTILATDDPTVYEESEFSKVVASQERIRLASKVAIDEANPNPHALRHFVDETFGWEGGFFAPMFWNLGVDRKNNAANAPNGVDVHDVNMEARHMAPPSEATLRLRSLIGRAYMMDLAVLAGASDQVVCAVSAMGCRLLAVMMGWEDGIEKAGWVNVDGSYGWTGINW